MMKMISLLNRSHCEAPLAESSCRTDRLASRFGRSADPDALIHDFCNQLSDMYATADAGTGRVVDCNQTLLDTLGLTSQQVIGRPLFDLFPTESLGAMQRAFESLRRGRELRNVEVMLRRADGAIIDTMLNAASVRNGDGNVVRCRCIWRDVTDLKLARMELQYQHAQLEEVFGARTAELERANQELAIKNEKLVDLYETAHRFVDNVSHEFRTPLTVIKGYTDVLLQGMGGDLSADQTEWLKLISDRSRDLAQMVDDLLDTSKLRAGMLRVDRRPVTFEAIAERVWPMLHSKAEANKITLEKSVPDDLPIIYADAEKAGRVLVNLVVNAVKFSPEGSTVQVWADHWEDGEIEIGVTDSGPGIGEENLSSIFNRFKQVGDPQRSSTKGFGLGLNIAKELAALNLGRMNVISETGQGSTFSFTLTPNDMNLILDRYLQRLGDYRPPGSILAVIEGSSAAYAGIEGELCSYLASQCHALDLIVEAESGSGAARILRVCEKPWQAVEELRSGWEHQVKDRPHGALPNELTFDVLKDFPFDADSPRGLKDSVLRLIGA